MMRPTVKIITIVTGAMLLSNAPVHAAKKAPVKLVQCDENLGTIAVVEGDTRGWTKYGLGSPRELIATIASQSGCFTLHNGNTAKPAKFLMNVIAGDKEEVDRGMSMARSAVSQGLWRSGAAGSLITKVPFGGAALGMFGGLGGRKKTVAAGIRVISPANGATIASGSGQVKKSTLSFGGNGGWAASNYNGSKKGKMLTEAFILAFNSVVAQKSALASVAPAVAAPAADILTAVDTKMFAGPSKSSTVQRGLRAGTAVKPTGKREGLFIEAEDKFGTKGWVSVEDLK